MAEFLRRRLQPGFYRCGPGMQRDLGQLSGHRVSTRLAKININKKGYTNELVNRASTGMTAKVRGPKSRLGWSLFIDPLATPLTRSEVAWNEVLTGLLPE